MKTAFIIGAGSGLGNGVAEKFAKEGFRIVLISRNIDNLKKYKEEFEEKGFEVFTKVADVGDFKLFDKAFNELILEFGTPDVLFYNVGITVADSEVKITPELMLDRYKNDVIGAYNCITLIDTKEFSEKKGTILITGGGLALNPYSGYLPLSMDKAALRAMVKALAPDLIKKNIFLGIVEVTETIGSKEKYKPSRIAEEFWKLYTERNEIEIIY